MAVTQPKTRPRMITVEQEWSDFIRTLPACEFHRLTKGDMELILHDEFCSGEIKLDDVRLMLSFDTIHPDWPLQ